MTSQMNQNKFFIISLVTIIILGATGFYFYNERRPIPTVEDDVQFNFSIDGNNYIMPSPFHSFHFLNTMGFSWKGLTDSSITSNYENESQIALNLGFRAADGIVLLFADEKIQAREVRTIVIELADKLDITPDIRDAVSALDNAAVLQVDKTVLDDRIIHLQYQIEKTLHKKKKDNLAVLVELGGWLEGLNIASKGIANNYNPGHAEILRQPHIAEIYLEVLTALARRSQNEKEKKLLELVSKYLVQISKVANHTHKESFPLEKVKELYTISSDVKKVIESNNDLPKK